MGTGFEEETRKRNASSSCCGCWPAWTQRYCVTSNSSGREEHQRLYIGPSTLNPRQTEYAGMATGHGTCRRDGATCPIAGEEGRCGRLRESMRTNPLLQPSETGKVGPGEKQGPSAAAAVLPRCPED